MSTVPSTLARIPVHVASPQGGTAAVAATVAVPSMAPAPAASPGASVLVTRGMADTVTYGVPRALSIVPATQASGVQAMDAVSATPPPAPGGSRVAMTVKTASGTKVELVPASAEDGGGMQWRAADGAKLTDAEMAALDQLSAAWQKTLGQFSQNPPQLDVSRLVQLDSKQLASIDLSARLENPDGSTLALDFHADAQGRTLDVGGPIGTVHVGVDLSDPAILGNPQRQAAAVGRYLAQFDAAATRGQADAGLLAMFKNAFAQMNGVGGSGDDDGKGNDAVQQAQVAAAAAASTAGPGALNARDQSFFTGLADFDASFSQSPHGGNPMRPTERDTFSYTVSQSTRVGGHGPRDRSLLQEQQAHLSASYHASLVPGVRLELTSEKKSQNYTFHQIDDTASSRAEVAYRDGALVTAQLTQSAQMSERVQKYEMARLVEDHTIPAQAMRSQDFLDLLRLAQAARGSDDPKERERWDQALGTIAGAVQLQPDPAKLDGGAWLE